MPKKNQAGRRSKSSTPSPDTSAANHARRVETNRIRFLTWLAEATGQTLHTFDFDIPGVNPNATYGIDGPAWWPHRQSARRIYLERCLDEARDHDKVLPPPPTLPLVTIYLCALELEDHADDEPGILRDLHKLAEAAHLPTELRQIAGQIVDAELVPDETWIGPLEWTMLQAAGVRWPGYVIDCAGLRGDLADEVERDIGAHLLKGLDGFMPTAPDGATWTEETIIRQRVYGRCDLKPMRLREVLIDAAGQAAVATTRTPLQKGNAAMGLLGLWIIMPPSESGVPLLLDRERLRGVSSTSADHPHQIVSLARRLLRKTHVPRSDELVAAYWAAADSVEDQLVGGVSSAKPEEPRIPPSPVLEIDGSGQLTVDDVQTGISMSSGPGDLLCAILMHKPKVLNRKANRTSLNKALLRTSNGAVGVARVANRCNYRKLTARIRLGPELRARLGVDPLYSP